MTTIAITTNRLIQPLTTVSLMHLVDFTQEKLHIVMCEQGYTVAENRNYAVVQAQKNKSDYLLFIDDDMTFPEDTLDTLLAHGKDIVGVKSYSRVLPLKPTVGLFDENGGYMSPEVYPFWEKEIPTELFKAYHVGTGLMLINMKVFDKIKSPYFEFTYHENGMVNNGEDGNFCIKAREAGFDVFCDPQLKVGHLGTYNFKENELKI